MKKVVLIVSALLFVGSIALMSCGSKASDNNNQAKTECCGDHGKAESKDCCDSTKVNSLASSTKNDAAATVRSIKSPAINHVSTSTNRKMY
ncbi:MAG TPA: hypothetical protein ENN49_02870 [Bacteroidales bacterium]|nr:hypothetical protein [Bacteroidales bacterium]